jgi:hypothetical protein
MCFNILNLNIENALKKQSFNGEQGMILAAGKPNYIPAIDYFYKMNRADIFIIADDIPYTSGGAINRPKTGGKNTAKRFI